jgi:hypothetical protein
MASEYFRRYSESFCECVRASASLSPPQSFSSGGRPASV